MGVLEDAHKRIFTSQEGVALNVGGMTGYAQQSLFVIDMLGRCGKGQINRFYSNKVEAELYSVVRDSRLVTKSWRRHKSFDLVKAADVGGGFDQKGDRFPEGWFVQEKHKDD